jgi:hypothetical protein
MARKLKTFQTSVGFYDLAIAAPSMKAALAAWSAGSNLFHQGVAKGNERHRRGRRDDVQTGRGTQAPCGIELTLRRAFRYPLGLPGKASGKAGEASRSQDERTGGPQSRRGFREGAEAA